jgi:hypothetical protein
VPDSETDQVNIRVSKDVVDALDAAVFVRELRSPQELLRPVVEKLGESLAADPKIKAALRLRRDERKKEKNNVHELPRKSGRRPSPSD